MRSDLWFLRDERGVDVDEGESARGEFGHDAAEKDLGVDVAEGRIGVGEKMPDVGESGGAEQGVTDGVGEAVGVGVAFEAEVGGEAHAAEDERAAGDEAVDIVAVADAEVHAKVRKRN